MRISGSRPARVANALKLLSAACLVLVPGVSNGVSVGVDFYSSSGGWEYHENISFPTHLDFGVPAGVELQSSWNAFHIPTTSNSFTGLVDSAGNPSPITVAVNAVFTYGYVINVESTTPAASPEDRNNARLLISQLGANTSTAATLDIAGIDYDLYDVIIYLGMDANGRVGSVTSADTTYYYSSQLVGVFGEQPVDSYMASPAWLPATVTSYATGDPAPPTANYVRFTGLSGATQSFTLLGVTGNVALTGFQVVQVPEPSTFALAGLAALALAGRRRRS